MPDIEISISGTDTLLKNLNPNKASGPDQIFPRLLKELHHEIAPILTKIYSSTLETGFVLDDWKSALVAPVYKKGPIHKPGNNRPISLTCIASKFIEYSRLSLSRTPRDSLKYFEISVPRHIRVEKVRKTINWTTTFNKWICNLTPEVWNIYIYIYIIMWKRGEIAP